MAPGGGPGAGRLPFGAEIGHNGRALVSSLVTTAVFEILALSLAPFRTGVLHVAGTYIEGTLLTLSTSGVINASSVLFSIHTAYGLLRSFTIFVPSALIILNTFSLIGGHHSSQIRKERIYLGGRQATTVAGEAPPREDTDDSGDSPPSWSYLE